MKVKNGASYDLIQSMTYNAKHQMLSSTDLAGQTTTYTHTASGQIETVTTPPRASITEQRTTTYTYDPTTGDLLSVAGPGGVTSSQTYDGYGRLRTTTDSDNYTLTNDYDILGRLTKTTYPDGTYEETQYVRLDPVRRRDRLGRWSQTFYDKVRRVAATRDPAGRVVSQQWCKCGSLDRLIDPNKNATAWERDVQGRATKEIRANGSFKSFLYETTTSRLRKVTDAKLQETQYTYALDDKLTAISYVNAEHPTPSVTFSVTVRPAQGCRSPAATWSTRERAPTSKARDSAGTRYGSEVAGREEVREPYGPDESRAVASGRRQRCGRSSSSRSWVHPAASLPSTSVR